MPLEISSHLITFRRIPFALPSSTITLTSLAIEASGLPIVNRHVIYVTNEKLAFQR